MYVFKDFSKTDRKKFVDLMGVAAQREAKQFFKDNLAAFKDAAENDHEDIRGNYWEMAEKFKVFSKHLRMSYDGFTQTNLPSRLGMYLAKNFLTENDIAEFSEETKEKLLEIKKGWQKS